MKKRTLFTLLLGLVLCLTVMTTRASAEDIVIPEIRIEGNVTSVPAGRLPFFYVISLTEHVNYDYESFSWVRFQGTNWFGLGGDGRTAVNDGSTHYGLSIRLNVESGYVLNESTKIYYNGVDCNNDLGWISVTTWGAILQIDLGLADGENKDICTVTYYIDETNQSDVYVSKGNVISELPRDPSKHGAIFEGWFTDDSFTTEFDFRNLITSNTTIYAKWRSLNIIPEVRIAGSVTSAVAGKLPNLYAYSTTEHVFYDFDAFSWVSYQGANWFGLGGDGRTAVKDGSTHYGLSIRLNVESGYVLDESTKIYYNGVDCNNDLGVIRLTTWGAYVDVDLGLAVDYGGTGWYMNEDDSILHLNGPVTNPSTMGVDKSPWQKYKSKITSVVCDPGASIDSGVMLFALCPNLTKADLRGLDTSGVKDLYGMFGVCAGLAEVDFTGLDTSAVESVESMFAFCQNLHVLDWKDCDLSYVTNAADLFTYSGLVRVTAGPKTLSGIADAMIAHEPGWRDVSSGAVYSTASGLKAITGTVTLDSFVGLIIPAGTKRIEAEAFRGIDAATVVIPNGCQYIGSQAFAGCANLTKVYIPSSVQTILSDAFVRCPHITIYTPTGSRAAQWCGVTGVPCVEY